MNRVIAVLVLLIAVVAAVGFYRGWFSVAWDRSDGKGQVTGTVDEEKIEADKKRAVEKVQEFGSNKANAAKE
jgi:hypothetical protein